jgi:4-hydroxybenzoate polyprenyltransferase
MNRPTQSLRAYFQLVRLPAVFTAAADIVLGFLLNHIELAPLSDLFALLAASACLYSSGMVWNDIFDRKVDAKERPERPIPSGRVRVSHAVALAAALTVLGVGAAALVGFQSLAIAAMLTVCILAYDGLLKPTLLGPPAMGACRFLNVMLGASAYAATIAVWSRPQTIVAAALGVYVAGITWFARTEARTSKRGQLISSALVVNVGLLALLGIALTHPWRGEPNIVVVAALLGAIILWIDSRLCAAVFDPMPRKVQAGVKTMIFALVLLDATIVLAQTGRPLYAGLTAALIVPGLVIGRWLSVT